MKFRLSLAVICMLLLGSTGCNKWLDVTPRSQIREDQFFTNERGFEDALAGIYVKMVSPQLYGDYLTMSFLDVLAQRYAPTNYYHFFKDDAVFLYKNQTVKTHIADIWRSMYSTLVNNNNILRYLEENQSALGKSRYGLIKGEALALRAFMHFDLLRMFGKNYQLGAGAPAIPYVTKVTQVPTELSTTGEVVTKVLADLEEALPLLEKLDPLNGGPDDGSQFLKNRKGRMNYLAVKALLARVYLFKGDKVNAYKRAKEVIDAGKHTFITSNDIINRTDYTFSGEHIFALQVMNIKDIVNKYFKYHEDEAYNSGRTQYELKNDRSVTQRVFETNSGGSTDYRYLYLFKEQTGQQYHIKFWQEDESNYNIKFRYLMPLIKISEMYYIAAETAPDLNTAITLLNKIRFNRGIPSLPEDLNPAQLQDEIRKEYQKEFYSEGQFFYYCKRLNLNKISEVPVKPENVYVLPLPDNEIDLR
ncbi:RagB/SusD family nutrient uptake outer membrane protein [Chitinophaga nivalis]|uniref:RagB/SusD family nutrient uptake outer membrane protein n=1 Tax=Chitinophaga nivalis TaxID=2991709 RepID=A0ABT3IP29_9BACT|nr:RagB/SusD family nutrient uptake outer membrane protein [Chitinophaga nivalis]MCW3464611.1 RagB/SusD family nutrient uptake outer membrane protein [Chitinophaga nivalis]MCW3485698.1 RagB/SusD family nutrient uptake outer membrane protein [Chitinophaga nivalis]